MYNTNRHLRPQDTISIDLEETSDIELEHYSLPELIPNSDDSDSDANAEGYHQGPTSNIHVMRSNTNTNNLTDAPQPVRAATQLPQTNLLHSFDRVMAEDQQDRIQFDLMLYEDHATFHLLGRPNQTPEQADLQLTLANIRNGYHQIGMLNARREAILTHLAIERLHANHSGTQRRLRVRKTSP
jgi:hypothetical protein